MCYNRVEIFCLNCDTKDYKHCTFPLKICESLVKESRRLSIKCFVNKVEYRKLPVVSCTHKSLQRDHARGW